MARIESIGDRLELSARLVRARVRARAVRARAREAWWWPV